MNILDTPTPLAATLTLSPASQLVTVGVDAQLTLELDRAPPCNAPVLMSSSNPSVADTSESFTFAAGTGTLERALIVGTSEAGLATISARSSNEKLPCLSPTRPR